MFPLSAISSTMPMQNLLPSVNVAPSEAAPLPSVPDLKSPAPLDGTQGITSPQSSGDSFANLLGSMVADVNNSQQTAVATVNNLQAGGNVSLHQAVIAMEEANVSFQLMVEVRNKMLDAYQEIMRMQV